MTLQTNDLRDLLDHVVEIDSYKSKMGADEDIITIAFSTLTRESANDLSSFIERGYSFVLDADATVGEQSDGNYRVFVEIERNNHAAEQILELMSGVKSLSGIGDMRFRYYKNFRSLDITQDNLEETIPTEADLYGIDQKGLDESNYLKFFSNSMLENISMWGDVLTIKKAYADKVKFKFVNFGPTQSTLDSITESFNANDFAEITFLSKYVGDYNITKYGNKLTFENNGNTLVLERL